MSLKTVFQNFAKDLKGTMHTTEAVIDLVDRYMPDFIDNASSGGGGSSVTYSQTATTGGECGTITIDDVATKIYSPIPYKFTSAVTGAISATSVTITDASIATTSVIDIFTETTSGKLVNVKQCVVTTGQAVLSFDALEESTSFKLQIFN